MNVSGSNHVIRLTSQGSDHVYNVGYNPLDGLMDHLNYFHQYDITSLS